MESDKFVKDAIQNENYDETIKNMLETIQIKENMLQEQINNNYNEVITKCAEISDLKIKNNIATITQRLNDFSFSMLINHNKARDSEELIDKLEHVLQLSITLQKILQKLEQKKKNIENYFDIKYIQKNIKVYKHTKFYDVLKIQLNEKRKALINKMNNECCEWLNNNLSLCKTIGEKIVNDTNTDTTKKEQKERAEKAKQNMLTSSSTITSSSRTSDSTTIQNDDTSMQRESENTKIYETQQDNSFEYDFANKNAICDRKKLNLTVVLECLYIYKKLELEDTFYSFFNTKRESIGNFLKIYDLIGLLYIDKILNDIDDNLQIKDVNTNYDKDELLVLLAAQKRMNMSTKKVQTKIDKICADYIFERQEYVNNKEDANKYFDDVCAFLQGVEESCVFEIFYKNIDAMFMKYYDLNEVEDALDRAKEYKNINFCFKSSKVIQDKIREEKEKIDRIFEEQAYEELMYLYICDDVILYIDAKFVDKMKNSRNKRKIDGEIAKFYKFLQKGDSKYSDMFYSTVKKCKELMN